MLSTSAKLPVLVLVTLLAVAGCGANERGADADAAPPTDVVEADAPEGDPDATPDLAEPTDLPPDPAGDADPDLPEPVDVPPEAEVDEAVDAPDETEPAFECFRVPSPPLTAEVLYGFEAWEDFAFDDAGNVVGAGPEGNLLRITKDGQKQVFFPSIGDTAGVGFLPGGDLVVNIVSTGSLVRVSPDGGSSVVLSGLAYPNGLEVDLDGFVYVSENSGGRVRRIDPDSGEYQVLATGLPSPNGLSFDAPYNTLYVGSFGAGTVHVLRRSEDGGWLKPELFGLTPGITDPCDGKAPGDVCSGTYTTDGTCEGSPGFLLDCVAADPCGGKIEGDDCETASGPGVCETGDAGLLCVPVDPCKDKAPGDPCDADGLPGTCLDGGGALACTAITGCDGLAEGDLCTGSSYMLGVCRLEGDALVCVEGQDVSCEGLEAGDACLVWGTSGACEAIGEGLLCGVGSCEGKAPGDACEEWGQPGACVVSSENRVCQPVNECTGKAPGDACDLGGAAGTCKVDEIGTLYCAWPDPCDGKAQGDPCDNWGQPGECQDQGWGLTCVAKLGCEGFLPGSGCLDDAWTVGVCAEVEGVLTCVSGEAAGCTGKPAGVTCAVAGFLGTCQVSKSGTFCAVGDCRGRALFDPCAEQDQPGVCQDYQGALLCQPGSPCTGLAEGDACDAWGTPGTCQVAEGYVDLQCLPPDPCEGQPVGAPCTLNGQQGRCIDDGAGVMCWLPPLSQGGLDGLGVDVCGHVYIAEYVIGIVWRFPPTGGRAEFLAALDSGWIPNVHWGSGLGGWDKNTLYVADRDQGRLFGLEVGAPGVPQPFP
jgi:sugar lactone lactonase YvrE